ncbi:hypothetical protein D3C81_344020 [compost metagenome]|jgi:hypothetical protein|uniref:hypothetical protein n=2 Tax=unclassified Janthinobacterium TaxID=2610881 RepID=UPI000C82E34D|nr:hypothetical protein [Janthinobacterium sp. AD80]PMQ13705.1 hypothetical protein JaAD80_21520 [Janthinobacterium sp. AD80]
MNMAKLSVHGDDPTLKSILEVLPSDPEREWRKGEAKAGGRVHLDSGFEVIIAHAPKSQVLPSRIRSYLAECRSRGVTFTMPRIVAELQLELHGDDTRDAPFDLTLADMQHLTEMGISLSIVTLPAA